MNFIQTIFNKVKKLSVSLGRELGRYHQILPRYLKQALKNISSPVVYTIPIDIINPPFNRYIFLKKVFWKEHMNYVLDCPTSINFFKLQVDNY